MANGNGNGGMPPKALSAISGTIGLCGGLMLSWATTLTDLAVLKEKVSSLDKKIEQGIDDRYRGADARKDHTILVDKIDANAEHIRELEMLLRAHAEDAKRHNGKD